MAEQDDSMMTRARESAAPGAPGRLQVYLIPGLHLSGMVLEIRPSGPNHSSSGHSKSRQVNKPILGGAMEQPHTDPRRSDPQVPPSSGESGQAETSQRSHKSVVYDRPLVSRKMKYLLWAVLIAALFMLFFLEPLLHIMQGWGND